jgi:hypothetical protein
LGTTDEVQDILFDFDLNYITDELIDLTPVSFDMASEIVDDYNSRVEQIRKVEYPMLKG